MPIIDSSSYNKFDALVRTNKADTLMAFISASYHISNSQNKKEELAKRLKSAYELFRFNVKGSESGAGTYGDGVRDIKEQFESHYTMGYEMGIWVNKNFDLNPLAKAVAEYNISVKEYIGIVFRNLFAYYDNKYYHFLYNILCYIRDENLCDKEISKEIIVKLLPVNKKQQEQGNLIYNYLIASDLFYPIGKNNMKISTKWVNNIEGLIDSCNLEYANVDYSIVKEFAEDKQKYADYVTKYDTSSIENTVTTKKHTNHKATNTILYGVPGCGKSHTIKENYCDDFRFIERVVFHPDYMNTDFIGQIMPTIVDGKITYKFSPGAFTRILKKAIEDSSNHYYLIIEEINRGNAPAIFGEVFQLLDRDKNGESTYRISNEDMAEIIYGESDKNKPIFIPSNLSLVATMNTADQNVFTLDTAFQRRWNMVMIRNNLEKVPYKDCKILDTDVSWSTFNNVINDLILEKNKDILSSEDKRLGAFFVSEEVINGGLQDLDMANDEEDGLLKEDKGDYNVNSKTLFSEKVIKYLWDDAFKLTRQDIFKNEYTSLEMLVDAFNNSSKNDKWNIFEDEVKNRLLSYNY